MITILLIIAAFFLGKYFGAKGAMEITEKVVKAYFEQEKRHKNDRV
jgi:uncharacterized membrane protein YfcA